MRTLRTLFPLLSCFKQCQQLVQCCQAIGLFLKSAPVHCKPARSGTLLLHYIFSTTHWILCMCKHFMSMDTYSCVLFSALDWHFVLLAMKIIVFRVSSTSFRIMCIYSKTIWTNKMHAPFGCTFWFLSSNQFSIVSHIKSNLMIWNISNT